MGGAIGVGIAIDVVEGSHYRLVVVVGVGVHESLMVDPVHTIHIVHTAGTIDTIRHEGR